VRRPEIKRSEGAPTQENRSLMTAPARTDPFPLLLLAAGAKGAIASTLAAAVAVCKHAPEKVAPCLTTADKFPRLASIQETRMAGWDVKAESLNRAAQCQGILPEPICRRLKEDNELFQVRAAPPSTADLPDQVAQLSEDIRAFSDLHPGTIPVLVNLLPAAPRYEPVRCRDLEELFRKSKGRPAGPDLAYALAAVLAGVPVVNFTPNVVEISLIVEEARKRGVPLAGRDGKTGQTYFKVVLASAFKARRLAIDGWYSLNILGNADGKNLMEPTRAAEKLANKTDLLDDILGYPVGHQYGSQSHKVHIDYYPPRGDAKEAWDVIDFRGLFDLPMSLRMNLQGRDSILAAPLVLDLARWMAALQLAGRSGPVAELGFYFKKPVGPNPPVTFQAQLACLEQLEAECTRAAGNSP
jgi:myo-inositol-1-phosphate synthase